MKTTTKVFAFLVALATSAAALGAAGKIVGGPKGGRLLETKPHRTEFFVNADRKVEITFYDAALKPLPATTQVVSITAEAKSGRKQLELERRGPDLVSRTALPESEPYRVVVQVRERPDARPQNFRIQYDMEVCAGCQRAEYACTCGH